MEAEEGDFVNVEIAFAYRPSTGRGIKSRAKHAHLYLAFYLPGKIKLRKPELVTRMKLLTNSGSCLGRVDRHSRRRAATLTTVP
jgi:hypothetical protein